MNKTITIKHTPKGEGMHLDHKEAVIKAAEQYQLVKSQYSFELEDLLTFYSTLEIEIRQEVLEEVEGLEVMQDDPIVDNYYDHETEGNSSGHLRLQGARMVKSELRTSLQSLKKEKNEK